ncbi:MULTISPECIES: MarC family protein [unclassified Hydrogenobaculum]|uniref:MarC family protein n=1 Tax=unclassified Hydrogenobaculum TaxID=2622382 RepID=UPI0001C5134D|nr:MULTISPECIES: MarC family protein [unclassified Hydrogenobaculum]AEF18955.1 multiple antibiotic resistance (MarC)-related protein [Hydrogenobaculum sp. 3684]AEG46242.1 multiple antibiotic resistance (MarC)-related protein [Hydrogenobaculum sp. SHO]AGG14887.1 multiple antibiotic resistance (MarC)-related protein [Hydrogenobaculum sp. HO]AGH93183.1 membrane protein, MarC family [Hydrogenobaculum sp. SN]
MDRKQAIDIIYFIIKFSISIFAILNPFGALPVLVSLTKGYAKEDLSYVVKTSSIYAGLTLIFFVLFGDLLFEIFGIGLGAFQIGGGIILSFVSVNMIFGQPHRERASHQELEEAEQKENIAIVPIAIPLLAGPGAISTVITIASSYRSVFYHVLLILSILVACIGVFLVFKSVDKIVKILGKIGINILSRLMGILLMSLAMQFIIKGIQLAFPTLGK